MKTLILVLLMSFFSSCAHQKLKIVDLTHSFGKKTIYWPTENGFKHEKEHFGPTEKGYFYSSYKFEGAEHGGTHIDAPIHFNENGETVDAIPLTRLLGPGIMVDVSEQCRDPDYQITKEDLEAFEKKHSQSLADKIVLLKTGFAQYWPDRERYLGTKEQGPDAVKKLHFPGLHPDAAKWLAEERKIRAVGIDTASIDFGQSSFYGSHQNLFRRNVPAFENVSNLDPLPPYGFEVIALPMKIENGSGAPLRIIAILP